MALITDSLRFILRSSPHLLLRFISFLPWVLAFSFLLSFPPSLILSFLFSYSVLSLSLSFHLPCFFLPLFLCLSVLSFLFLVSFPCVLLCLTFFPFPCLFFLLVSYSASFFLSLSLSFMDSALFFNLSFSLSVNSSFLFSFSHSLTPILLSPCIPSNPGTFSSVLFGVYLERIRV